MEPVIALMGEGAGIKNSRRGIRRLPEAHLDSLRFSPILIEGETGMSEGLLVRAVHQAGRCTNTPFFDVSRAMARLLMRSSSDSTDSRPPTSEEPSTAGREEPRRP